MAVRVSPGPRVLDTEFAIIPTYNEEGRVGVVVRALRRLHPQISVVVVDDGSTDATREEALAAGATVVPHLYNLGYASALETGYRYVLKRRAARCVQLDADGQHDASAVDAILGPVRNGTADVVIGSRFLGGPRSAISVPRRLGIATLRILAQILTGQRWSDPMSGYLGLDQRALKTLTEQHLPHDYADVDVLISMWAAGLRFAEVPVTMRSRDGGRSMYRGIGLIYYVYKMTLAMVIAAWRGRGRRLRARGRSLPSRV